MTIFVKIEKDSLAPSGKRLTTFILKYPRFIHSEFMTHRAFSRNASSSRAIPFEKQVQMIEEDMAMPIEFRANQKGMQAGSAIADQRAAKGAWTAAGFAAINHAKNLNDLGVHKQYVNRIIEPFTHITVVCTATEYANFFALRHHSMAQPEIAELAKQMWELYSSNEPEELALHQWHLPFITDEEKLACSYTNLDLVKMSVARCARVSYKNHDGSHPNKEADYKLYNRLLGSQPIHASPAEHQAEAVGNPSYQSGNFYGWIQYRQKLLNQDIKEFNGPLG
jgi:thymidylate synthase ThyX